MRAVKSPVPLSQIRTVWSYRARENRLRFISRSRPVLLSAFAGSYAEDVLEALGVRDGWHRAARTTAMIVKTFIMAKEIRAIRAKSLRANKIFRDHDSKPPGRS
jgi:hypothetical protein